MIVCRFGLTLDFFTVLQNRLVTGIRVLIVPQDISVPGCWWTSSVQYDFNMVSYTGSGKPNVRCALPCRSLLSVAAETVRSSVNKL